MIGSLPKRTVQIVAAVVIVAVLVSAGYYVLFHKSVKKVTAHFTAAVGVYPGSDVRMLGIKIGKIDKVTPDGTSVEVRMEYDSKYKLPADAIAVIIPPSIVSDRYVQVAPVYKNGPVLPDHGDIPLNRTASPAELDDIYKALNTLSTALGPQGANKAPAAGKNGPLSDLVNVLAANLKGTGTQLGQTVADLSQATTTLANNREDLFGTVKNLRAFSDALVKSDAQVRKFNDQLAQVARDLSDERQSLAAALHNLSVALTDVSGFIKNNEGSFHSDVAGLKVVTNILIKQKGSLDEVLSVAPVALANLAHTYNPSSGTLDNRANIDSLTDPAVLCGTLQLLGELPKALSDPITKTCIQVASVLKTTIDGLAKLVSGLQDSLPPIPGLPGAGSANKSSATLPTIPGITR
jgi:phospholipid/cholesterol/gamma-HCH transport system substrate-binding protein